MIQAQEGVAHKMLCVAKDEEMDSLNDVCC